MKNKGYFVLESLLVFSLGITLLLACLQTYKACLITMQKKLLLEKTIIAADLYLIQQEGPVKLQITELDKPTAINNLTLKEVQIRYEDRLIFTITTAQ